MPCNHGGRELVRPFRIQNDPLDSAESCRCKLRLPSLGTDVGFLSSPVGGAQPPTRQDTEYVVDPFRGWAKFLQEQSAIGTQELLHVGQAFLEVLCRVENVRCDNKIVLAVLESLFEGILTDIQDDVFHVGE